jgi:hypothetical protein
MLSDYMSVWVGYANIFIATFILVYAYLFLEQTNEHRDRRPWDFLFVASLLYLIFQIFNIMFLSGVTMLFSSLDIDLVRNIFAFLYSGCVLLAFISQHDLILRSHLILISKKDPKKPLEKDLEVRIGLGEAAQAKK